jgi:hypothetical protein
MHFPSEQPLGIWLIALAQEHRLAPRGGLLTRRPAQPDHGQGLGRATQLVGQLRVGKAAPDCMLPWPTMIPTKMQPA